MREPRNEVRVEDWRLGVIAGDPWLHPEGDGYEPDRDGGEAHRPDVGDVWVEGPGGVSATISWQSGRRSPLTQMLASRKPGDLGVFSVSTDVAPISRLGSEAFLRQLLPSLRALAATGDIGEH